MTTLLTTIVEGERRRSISVGADPFHDRFDAPFALLTRPLVARCSGDVWPNWDGTPAHSSGLRGRSTTLVLTDLRRQQGGVA